MKRALLTASICLVLTSCQAPPERAALRPLPDDGPPLPYAELLTRARYQASVATESFYVDKWNDLEDAAKGLEQTAHFLAKAEDVPAKHKDSLPVVSGDLAKESTKLLEAAKAKDVKEANDSLQRVHLLVRGLRLDN